MTVARLASALAAAIAGAVLAPAHGQTVRAERPAVTVGDSWEYAYRDTRFIHPGCKYSLTVEKVSGSRISARVDRPDGCDVGITGTMPVASGSVQTYDLDFNHFYYSKSAYRALDFPLEVGKTWVQTYEYKIGLWNYSADLTAEVVAVESVTVPAGTFEAFKVIVRRTYEGKAPNRWTQSGRTTDTVWYAPVIKNVVKRSYSDVGPGGSPSPIQRELTSFILK